MSGTIINYVDAICGSGKTTELIRHIDNNFGYRKNRICVVQPTAKLLRQTEAILSSMGIPATIIAGTDDKIKYVSQNIVKKIVDYVKDNDSQHVLLITHAAFLAIEHWDNPGKWNIFVDEIPSIAPSETINIVGGSLHIKNIFDATHVNTSINYYSITAIATGSLQNAEKAGYKTVVQWAKNRNMDVYCLKSQFDNVSLDTAKQITFYGFLKPDIFDGFNSTTILSAHFVGSMIYHAWKNKVKFIKSHDIGSGNPRHLLGCRKLTIHYISRMDYSKSLMERHGLTESMTAIEGAIKTIINGEEFIWAANNNIPDNYVQIKNRMRISNVSHGINDYRHINKVLILSALNHSPAHMAALLELCAIDPDQIREGVSHASIYQTILRSSLRESITRGSRINSAAFSDVDVIVPDLKFASWFGGLFVGEVHVVPLIEGLFESTQTKPMAMSAADRQRKHREKIRNEKLSMKEIEELNK